MLGGCVPGEGGEGTSMFGVVAGSSAGAWLGCAGGVGAGAGGGLAGVSGMGGCCCIEKGLLSRSNDWSGGWVAGARRGLPNARACYRRRTFKRPRGRGGIGRRAGFRFQYRKMWGFESLRPHQPPTPGRNRFHRDLSNVTIKTVETENEGLKRGFMLTIPAEDIEARVEQEVKRLAPQIRMPGFRPGKVPPNLIRKMHGDSLRGEALQGAVQDGVQQLLSEQKIRPALQPQVELDDGYAPGKDAEVRVSLEALPDVGKPAIDDIALDRLTVEPDDAAVAEQIKQLASQSKRWEDAPKKHAATTGDLVVMDFEGKVDGKPFEGGKGEDMQVEIGTGRLIPGFEEQLVGVKTGDTRELNVTFPEDYPAENLKGKHATFAVTVKAVKTGGENRIDDEFAKSLGLNDLEQLQGLIRGQVEQELNGLTRTHMKRQLLDQLAARHDFEVPQSMVDAEYDNILGQLRHEASHEADPQKALAEIDEEAGEYRKIAERRVRLGLLLSEIGAANGVDVTEQEMQRPDHAGGIAISGQGPREFRPLHPAGADGRRPAARAALRGQGRRFPVRAGRR